MVIEEIEMPTGICLDRFRDISNGSNEADQEGTFTEQNVDAQKVGQIYMLSMPSIYMYIFLTCGGLRPLSSRRIHIGRDKSV